MNSGIALTLLLTVVATTEVAAQHTEHYFRFAVKQKSDLDALTRVISIADVVHDTVYAYANEKEWTAFKRLDYDAVELPYPGRQFRREVAVLVSERRDAGVHEIRFDGSGLSSGVYVCRLHALDAVQSEKLVLLK